MLVKLVILLVTNYILPYTCGLKEDPSILIIGAGPSGIAAASRLWKNSFTNLRILEAEDRIGGRIHSVKFGDAYLDLGGEWCHGEEDNIVYDMVKQYNILRHTTMSMLLHYSNGTLLDKEIYDNLVEFSESMYSSLNNTDIEGRCVNCSSVGQCFHSQFNTTFAELYQNNSDLQTITIEAQNWAEGYILGYDSAFTLYDLACTSAFKQCEGDQALNWDGRGYKTILEVMLQQYPDPTQELAVVNNILLNKEVTKISWSKNTPQVQVDCLDNTTYTADHVIFTASLGVLKANHKNLFEPSLPNEKVLAINNIGFGAIMKVILQFPHTWWDSTLPHAFIWSAADTERILTEFGKGPVRNGRSWLTACGAFLPAENNPKVLIGFFAGEMVPEIEQESNEVLSDGCMYMFRKFLGKTYSNITNPIGIIKSTWYNNPHFRGTYSYDWANNTEKGLQDKLAAPLIHKNGKPGVLFAGEATHPYYFSTVHGAIEAGYREANRLIDYYKRN